MALALALVVGGGFSAFWTLNDGVRTLPLGGAAAVLLILALPAYAAGAMFAALHARHSARPTSGIGAAALTGVALGVLLTTTLLIQNLQPHTIYYTAAAIMLLIGTAEARRRPLMTGDMTMNGKVAIVTGVGNRNQLGYTIAQALLDGGARIVVTNINTHVEELAKELSPAENVTAVAADLTSDTDIERLISAARERFGRVDALLNVAGGLSVTAPIADTTPEQWQREIQRNAETVLRVTRAALPLLRETRGAIVNFTSPAGLRASGGLGAYSAAKAAVIAITRALAVEEKENGVRVNAIAPGTMDTGQNIAALGDDVVFVPRADVAAVAVFLASPSAAGITG
jgi:NAD(P)-dependent dehydrogenase (short-subunit alcohol dehydrogenase family)